MKRAHSATSILGIVKEGEAGRAGRGREPAAETHRRRAEVDIQALEARRPFSACSGQKRARPRGNAGIPGIVGILESVS